MKIEKKLLEIPFDCINGLITEPCLKFTPEGLTINAFSTSNIAMCIFNLPKEKFAEYNFVKEERVKVEIELLARIMKRIKTKFINLELTDQSLIISDENKKEYIITTISDDETERDVPQIPFSSSFEIDSSKLQSLFLDASLVADEIKLETKEKQLILSAGTLNKFSQNLSHEVKGIEASLYDLTILNKFMVATKYFKNVLFEFGSGDPCKLTFKDELEIQFILAARCE